jgi:hypothetical protein
MWVKESRLPVALTVARRLLAALAVATSFSHAWAQAPVARTLTFDDIRQALIWTGNYDPYQEGDQGGRVHAASQAWQKSKGYTATESLTDPQVVELMAEATKKSAPFGWSMLRDNSVGFSIGIPTRLVKFLSTRNADSLLYYDFEGAIGYSIAIQYGTPSCMTFDAFYARVLQRSQPSYHVRQQNWFAVAGEKSGRLYYNKVFCSPAGLLITNLSIARSQVERQGIVMAAIADSVKISRNFDTTAAPHPKIDATPSGASGPIVAANGTMAQPEVAATLAANVDRSGKTDAVKRETWNGSELRTEQVFAKAAAAVYVVRTDKMLGSAVAVGEHELLTNCHVVGNASQVTLKHDKLDLKADVVSGNVKADRCVLHSPTALASWVSVRPYDDIKVGEKALSIGSPVGLELTVAEGLVSSKRATADQHLIQTSAPISPGSSGGGLFDVEGHLLAITTFNVLIGQNLNFAVAAEEYAR